MHLLGVSVLSSPVSSLHIPLKAGFVVVMEKAVLTWPMTMLRGNVRGGGEGDRQFGVETQLNL